MHIREDLVMLYEDGSEAESFWSKFGGGIITLAIALVGYLVFAHHKEWWPFPHHATQAELVQKANYEQLDEIQAHVFDFSQDIAGINAETLLLRGRHKNTDPSTWPDEEQDKLIALLARRLAVVEKRNPEAARYNAMMKRLGYPFTTVESIPVIVADPHPLPRQLAENTS